MPLLISLFNLAGLELVYFKFPFLIYPLAVIITAISLWFILRYRPRERGAALPIIISLVIFLATHYLWFLFLEGKTLIHSFIILANFALFIFLLSFFDKYKRQKSQVKFAFENVLGTVNLASFFFLSVGLLYLDLNVNQQFIWLLLIFIAAVTALTFSSLKIWQVAEGKGVWYLSVILLITVEFFWLINLLPISVYSKGAVLTIIYYLILGLGRHYLIFGWGGFSSRIVWRYLIIGAFGVTFLLLSSRW